MSLRSTKALALGFVMAAAWGVIAPAAAADDVIDVCIDQASPTADFDRAVANAVGERLDNPVAIETFDGTGDDESGFAPGNFVNLAETRCDVIMGFPVAHEQPRAPDSLEMTEAYLDTGYVLVTRDAARPTLAELPAGERVAVAFQTPANLLLLDRPKLKPVVVDHDEDGLKSVLDGNAAGALVWEANLRRAQDDSAKVRSLHFRPVTQSRGKWSLVALYSPANAATGERFNAALQQVRADSGTWKGLHERVAPLADADAAADDGASDSPGDASTLYSAAQAEKGERAFKSNCAECHGDDLGGKVGPALRGPHFADPSYNFTVGGMFTFMATQMPAGAPGSLSKPTYAAIMAFLLRENGYAAGADELSYDAAMGSKEPLVWRGDDSAQTQTTASTSAAAN